MKIHLTTFREVVAFLCTAIACLTLPQASGVCTTKSDYETVISGYPESHAVDSVVFDMDESTSDIAVGGRLGTASEKEMAYLFLADEHLCKVTWYYTFPELNNGISIVAFSTSEPGVVYGLGSGTGI